MESTSGTPGEGQCVKCGNPLTDRNADELCAECQSSPSRTSKRVNAEVSADELSCLLPQFSFYRDRLPGGMSSVYKAYDKEAKRFVAVKAIGETPSNGNNVERFVQEYQLLARFDHPNIPALYHSNAEDCIHYMVIEWVDGGSLEDRLGSMGQLPYEKAVMVLEPVCLAVEHMHDVGFLHRDIKPANILISGDMAKLTDFGLAKPLNGNLGNLTTMKTLMGTPEYMPREQSIGGSQIDKRADVFSLGAILYRLLTGKILGEGSGNYITDGVPKPFVPMLERSLERTKALRTKTVKAFREEMLEACERTKCRRYVRMAAIPSGIVGVMAMAYWMWRSLAW